MPSSCKEIRAALAECLQNSDCVFVERNKPGDCLRAPLLETLPTRCQQLKKGYGDCKRGMVDMRKRFRGNYPIAEEFSSGKKGGADGTGRGGQLYAGKSYYAQESSDAIGAKEEKKQQQQQQQQEK